MAVIMDGNGRWARQQGKERVFGHQNGVEAVRQVSEAAAELGVKYLTLYAFSTENWNRPANEVEALMELIITSINEETDTLMKNQIRLSVMGDISRLSPAVQDKLDKVLAKTADNQRMTLNLALSYSSRWEIHKAIQTLATEVKEGLIKPEQITEQILSNYLCTAGMPDPELLIRTSGEKRISNFLLWQLAYAELWFTEVLWPDFTKEVFFEAIIDFQKRERRFGKTSEQIQKETKE